MSKRLVTVASMACMKGLLMVLNSIFWVSGIVMLCTGIWLRKVFRDHIDISIEGTTAIPLVLACFGAVLTLAATLACCCTARGHPALLYLYGAFLAVVALLGLAASASIYAYRNHISEKFDQALNESMAVYGQDAAKAVDIDDLQTYCGCCGNRGYTDWLNMYPQVPSSCCKVPEKVCNVNDTNDIYTEGCYTHLLGYLNSNIVFGIGIGVFPLVGVFLACCLASNINKAKYEQLA